MANRDRLEAATDELTQLLDDAELFFTGRSRNVSAAVMMGDSGVSLNWERRGSEWRLVIGAKTIEEANRAGRVLAALHLDALLEQLEKNERAVDQDLRVAIETAATFVKKHAAGVPMKGTGDGR